MQDLIKAAIDQANDLTALLASIESQTDDRQLRKMTVAAADTAKTLAGLCAAVHLTVETRIAALLAAGDAYRNAIHPPLPKLSEMMAAPRVPAAAAPSREGR